MADPVSDLLDAERDRRNRLGLSLRSAVAQDPDAAARNNDFARRMNIPPRAAATDPKTLEQHLKAREAVRAAANHIALEGHLVDTPGFADAAHDDIGTLAKIERLAKTPFAALARGIDSAIVNDAPVFPDLGKAVDRDFTAGKLGRAAAAAVPRAAGGLLSATSALTRFGTPRGIADTLLEHAGVNAPADPSRLMLDAGARGLKGIAGEIRPQGETQAGRDILQAVESLPASMLAVGVSLLTRNPSTGSAVLAASVGGESYQTGVDQGMRPAVAAVYGGADAAVEYFTEFLSERLLVRDYAAGTGFGKMFRDQIVSENLTEQAATALQDFNAWAMLPENADKSFGDYLAERPEAARQTAIAATLGAGVMTGMGRVLRGVDVVTGRAARREEAAQRAQEMRQRMADLNKLVAASALRERDATSFKAFLADAAEGTEIETIYIAPDRLGEVFNQSGLDEQQQSALAETFGPRIAEAVEQGTDVAIPTAEFATLIADTPAEEQLLEHVKVDPHGMTKAEADEWMATRGEALRAEIDDAIARAIADDEHAAQFEAIKGNIVEQLNAARRFTPQANDQYATMLAAVYETLAQRVGITAQELWSRMPVRIQAQGLVGETLGQGADQTETPEFKNWFGNSKVTDAAGKPLVVYHGTNQPIDAFSKDRLGGATKAQSALEGFFFTSDPYVASLYADNAASRVVSGVDEFERKSAALQAKVSRLEKQAQRNGDWSAYEAAMAEWEDLEIEATREDDAGQNTVPVYLAMRRPKVIDVNRNTIAAFNGDLGGAVARAKAEGYDGLILKNIDDTPGESRVSDHYVVFDPTQIKSAIGNNGQFDPNDPNILRQSDQVFYSALERAVENIKTTRASGEQWLATLSKTPGVKKEELEWTGLPEWLKAQDGPISRDEVLAFVREGGVQVEEVVLGDPDEDAVLDTADRLRDEWIDARIDDMEFDVQVDYPDVTPSDFDENDDPIEWEVDGDYFDSEEAALSHADKLVGQLEQEARDKAEREMRRDLEDRAPDFTDEARLQVQEYGGSTKFESYTEGGGEDYRELLLTLPPGVRGNPEKGYYHSGHFSDQPVIAHIRFKSRKSADGKDVMFIEEVQSDWHQQGREKGYATAPDEAKIAEARRAVDKAQMALDVKVERLRSILKSHSDAGILREIERTKKILASGKSLDEMGGIPVDVLEGDLARMKAELDGFGAARLKQSAARTINLTEVTTEETKALIAALEAVRDAEEEHAVAERELNDLAHPRNNIPDAPFKSTPAWAGLAMKRAIRWAADNGFDQIAWTTGEQQAERYDMSRMLEAVEAEKLDDGRYVVNPLKRDIARQIIDRGLAEANANGLPVMTRAQIREVYGADLGGRLVDLADDQGRVRLSGDGLKIGGEGMKAFYDKMLPNITKDIIKKYGSSVRPIAVKGMSDDADKAAQYRQIIVSLENAITTRPPVSDEELAQLKDKVVETFTARRNGNGSSALANAERAAKYDYEQGLQRNGAEERLAQMQAELAALGETGTNLGFDITPELRQAANQGFALFQKERGAYSPATDTITLLANADLSTFLHESGHFFLEMLHRLATDPGAPQQLVDDWNAVLKWFGVTAEDWNGYTLNQKRVHHEKWARAFEAYLFTGKAPAVRLQGVFSRFRAWLIAVYKKATALGVAPTPQIRDVMDRLLATDEQIAEAAAARSMLPLFESREASGMNPDQWREYQAQARAASEAAIADLEARSLRDMQWLTNARGREVNRLKRKAAAIRRSTREQVAAEVMAEPVYRARLFLTKGLLDGQKVDGPHRFSIPEVDALYGDTPALKAIKDALGYGAYGMLSAENGLHPEQVAELFGFTSADHLIREVMAAEDMKAKIDALTEKRLLEEHGDLNDEQAVEDAANRAIHNDARARFVATELSALDKATGKAKTLAKAARVFAQETINRIRVRDLRPSLYEAAAARAGKASTKALAEGNMIAAAAEKRNQLVNIHAAKAAMRAREEIDRALEYFARLGKPGAVKTIDPEYMEQINTLLAAVDLRRGTTLRAIDSAASLAAWIEKQRDMGFEPVITEEMQAILGRKRSYKEMTVEEMRGLVDAVKNIEHLGRLKNRLLTAKKQRDMALAVAEMVESIKGNAVRSLPVELEQRRTVAAMLKKFAIGFLAAHRKVSSLIRQMDGFRDGGPVWQYLARGMNAAGDREAVMRDEANTRLAAALKPLLAPGGSRPLYIPEIGTSLTLEGRAAIALNMGNATNLERLLTGENWSMDQLAAVAATLTAGQWRAVQEVWGVIGAYWPEIAAKELRVTGVAPERVEPQMLQVRTSDGETLLLPGGYYPIRYNSDRSAMSATHELGEVIKQQLLGTATRATTRRGHTKERVESTGRALRYDLGVVIEHVQQVIHDLAWHEWLIDANRLLRAKPIDAALREHYGPEVIRNLQQAFVDIAIGELPAKDEVERLVNRVRVGVSIAGLGYNLGTALTQFTGFSQSLTRLSPKWLGLGLRRSLGSTDGGERMLSWAREQSPFMRERANTQQRELEEVMNRLRENTGPFDGFRRYAFWLIAKAQLMVDLPTWCGAYEKAMASGAGHEEAVAIADQTVLDTQGGGQIKDLAKVQRGGPFQKMLTNFYSFMNTVHNLMAEEVGHLRLEGRGYAPEFALNMALLSVIPTTLTVLLKAAFRPHGDPDDELELLVEDLTKQNLGTFFSTMVIVRDVAAAAQVAGRYTTPAADVYNTLVDTVKQAAEGEIDDRLLRDATKTIGWFAHLPAGQIDRTRRGAVALYEGETSNPMALAFGPPRKPRQ